MIFKNIAKKEILFLFVVVFVFQLFNNMKRVEASTSLEDSLYIEKEFKLSFNYYEKDKMTKADGWKNGKPFNCVWDKDNITFNNSIMSLWINNGNNNKYTGAEYRSNNVFGYGYYKVSMKPIKNDGVVSSFFIYTGPGNGTQWDEIDIEFLGKDTTKVQFNYFTNGVGNNEFIYDLGFDASEDFHTYEFRWLKDSIRWYVDGKEVHKATKNIPNTPGKIMMNVWPGIGVDGWLNPYDGKVPLKAEYSWVYYYGKPDEIQMKNPGVCV